MEKYILYTIICNLLSEKLEIYKKIIQYIQALDLETLTH